MDLGLCGYTFSYPFQIRTHWLVTPCIVPVFLPLRSMNRGGFRSARIRRLIDRPLRLSGPHHSRRDLMDVVEFVE